MAQRKAIFVDPPPVSAGRQRCPCCDGPLGTRSWGMRVCLVCYDAEQGRRTSALVYMVRGTRGGSLHTVKFTRKHRHCPLRNCP